MNWNYRVMEFIDSDGERYREIREVYYAVDGKPNAYSAVAATVMSNDVDGGEDSQGRKLGLAWVLDRMREALDKPILKESDFSS
jgi:hypothetical protein